jgi:two-component system cell cycle sensor histidine kinase/response regulator CckA
MSDATSKPGLSDSADQALRDSEARLSSIIASAMDAIIAVDEAQQIVLFNHAAETVFRCTAAEALGAPLDRFIPARFREAHREHVRRFAESGVTMRRMGRLDPLSGIRADGEEFPIEASISHAEVGGRRVFTVILRDVSERRRLEEQLLHAQRLESVGRLAGGIAHDFNNVLTAIFGYLDLAQAQVEPRGPVSECLEAAQKAAQRAAELTSQLLAFARKQVIRPQVVDLNELVRGALGMAARLLGEEIEVVLHTAPLLPNVRVDPGQFEQVLINLAVNAGDAMPQGGRFIVETSGVELDEEYVRLHPDVRAGPHVLLAVSDTGAGMDPVALEHCFEPFFTTKGRGRGTGLGLSTCYGIVHQSGGHITVYSERGRGTTFRIYLPACGETAARATPAGARRRGRGGSETVLLVEDDALVRGIAVRTLREQGYEVLEAANADEALARSAQTGGTIHLLLTDVVLPGIGGDELAQRLSKARPDLRVLYTSGFAEKMIARRGARAPDAPFLPKPYTSAALAAKVRDVLDAARPAGRAERGS